MERRESLRLIGVGITGLIFESCAGQNITTPGSTSNVPVPKIPNSDAVVVNPPPASSPPPAQQQPAPAPPGDNNPAPPTNPQPQIPTNNGTVIETATLMDVLKYAGFYVEAYPKVGSIARIVINDNPNRIIFLNDAVYGYGSASQPTLYMPSVVATAGTKWRLL